VHILAITSSGLANIELFWGAEGRKYVKSVDWISPETPRTIKKTPVKWGTLLHANWILVGGTKLH